MRGAFCTLHTKQLLSLLRFSFVDHRNGRGSCCIPGYRLYPLPQTGRRHHAQLLRASFVSLLLDQRL
jgi:hypothetical protein